MSTMVSEELPQHMRALARANRTRLARAGLKRRIGAGEISVSEVLRDPPWYVDTMTIGELLRSRRRWGRTRTRKFLFHFVISENRELARLSDRQRAMLADEFEAREVA